jgi:hypothetical protein
VTSLGYHVFRYGHPLKMVRQCAPSIFDQRLVQTLHAIDCRCLELLSYYRQTLLYARALRPSRKRRAACPVRAGRNIAFKKDELIPGVYSTMLLGQALQNGERCLGTIPRAVRFPCRPFFFPSRSFQKSPHTSTSHDFANGV